MQLSCSVVHEHHIFSGHPPRRVDAFSLFLPSPRILPRSVRGPLVLLPEVVANSLPPLAGRYQQHGWAPAVTVPATAAGANTATGTAGGRFAWKSPFHSPTPACRSVALYSYRWCKSGLRALLLFLLVVAATGSFLRGCGTAALTDLVGWSAAHCFLSRVHTARGRADGTAEC